MNSSNALAINENNTNNNNNNLSVVKSNKVALKVEKLLNSDSQEKLYNINKEIINFDLHV
jgi:hypothetical protein